MKLHRLFPALSLVTALTVTAGPAQAQSFRDADSGSDAQAGFGSTVAISAGEILVGEPGNVFRPGMLYVYQRDEDGQWNQSAILADAAGRDADRFAGRLALDGNTLLASVNPRREHAPSVAVFRRGDDGAWQSDGSLPHETVEDERFGSALALAGGTAFVGVPDQGDGTGAVYLYRDTEDGWVAEGSLAIEDSASRFGSAIAVSGAHMMVGAPGANEGSGAIYHFHNTADGWTNMGALSIAPLGDSASVVSVGSVLEMHGDNLFAGVPQLNGNNGGVLVFEFDSEDSEWSEQSALMPYEGVSRPSRRRGPRFGASISIQDDAVWVGASGARAVYMYSKTDAGWAGVKKFTPADPPNARSFGGSLAAEGDLAVIGASGANRVGSATVLERVDGAWTEVAVLGSEPESLDPITASAIRCEEGEADRWGCNGVDLISFLPVTAIGGPPGIGLNDMWGWYDEQTGREVAIVGRYDGTSFVDVTDPMHPRYLGNLPMTEGAQSSVWRDMKVYGDHAFIVSDGAGDHGMQVFDLTRLRDIQEPVEFEADYLYDQIASAHNIVMNERTGFAYVVGASGGGETCGGGLHMIDVREPKNPTFAGCFADGVTGRRGTGYSHDAQCVTYRGPDSDYEGKEICIGANETALSLADVTDKDSPIAISTASYPNVGYTHQGWLSDDHTLFFSNDEGDEPRNLVETTRTLVWDVADLDDPVLLTEYFASTTETDHNLYVRGNLMYQSNYGAGLRILDISDPENIEEVGFFDTDPDLGCCGSWSNYPYFRSGAIGVTGGSGGFFMVRKREDLVP
ncbi:MAG: choice-of-anchor B family protein [Gemmatimonadota bacterium]